MINVNCKDCNNLVESLYLENGKWNAVYYCVYCGHPITNINQNVDCSMYEKR